MKKHEIIDTETGELIPAIVWIRRPWKGEHFFMGFHEGFTAIAKDKEISLEAKNILYYLLGKLDFENFILISQVEIAQQLGMHKSNVSRAMKSLVNRQVILEGPKNNRTKTFRLNHNFGWKGKLSNLRILRNTEMKTVIEAATHSEKSKKAKNQKEMSDQP